VASGASGESQMGSWQEFFQPVLPSLIGALAPIVPAMAQMLLAKNARRSRVLQSHRWSHRYPPPQTPHPAGGEPAPQQQLPHQLPAKTLPRWPRIWLHWFSTRSRNLEERALIWLTA